MADRKVVSGKYYIKNLELVGYHDLQGRPGFQMAYQVVNGKHYLYCASFRHSGWSILDVTDPENPRQIKWLEGPDPEKYPGQGCPKIQVADGLMICALGGSLPMLHGNKFGDPFVEGLLIFDVKEDPENPKQLAYWSTGVPGGGGVHRFFYNGGRYVHLSACCPGYSGMIYRILDIADPTHPVEVGRWAPEGQYLPSRPSVDTPPRDHEPTTVEILGSQAASSMHGPAYVQGNYAYLSWGGGGFYIVDISDITMPKQVGHLPITSLFGGGCSGARCHTAMPLTGRDYAVVTNEGERFACFDKEMIENIPQPMNNLHMVSIKDKRHPFLVAEFPYPEVPADYPYPNFNDCGIGCDGPFGPHNIHEPHDHPDMEDDPNRIYCCYFHAGLRIYDTSDPHNIKEIAYFIPPNPDSWKFDCYYPGPRLGTTEDIIVDKRGYIYVDTFHDGVYILKMKDGAGA